MVAGALNASRAVELPEAHRARASAFIITASEAASLHLTRLRERPNDFDPFARDRLIAGAMLPASLVAKAHKFRRWFRDRMNELFEEVDLIIAPATPCVAPKLGETTLEIDGKIVPLRPFLGLYTQPISFAGLPVVAVPVPLKPLPIGVQIIAPPWREDLALRAAHALEQAGVVAAPKGVL
jgi:Asp-tRNA(Asn)/Glu-tRNA(Gln) amidotransferase A subunit family amidase